MSNYSDDVAWQTPEMENVLFGGKRKGREQVKQFFCELAEAQEALEFSPQEFIAQGNKVVVLGNYSWRVKASGRQFSSDSAHVVTVTEGKSHWLL